MSELSCVETIMADPKAKSPVQQEPHQAVPVDIEFPESVASSNPENRETNILKRTTETDRGLWYCEDHQ